MKRGRPYDTTRTINGSLGKLTGCRVRKALQVILNDLESLFIGEDHMNQYLILSVSP